METTLLDMNCRRFLYDILDVLKLFTRPYTGYRYVKILMWLQLLQRVLLDIIYNITYVLC